MQVVDASGNMFGYDSITVAGPDGRPKTISTAIKLVTLVRNTSGATITKGTVVYINGGLGNKPTIAKALATSDATSAQTYGVVQANIPNNKNGYVVVIGALDGLNTSAYSPGTQLYLSSTVAGEWTSTRQLAPAHLVYVAIVTRQHVNQGVVEVKIQNGYELEELHDVQITSPTNGQTLIYDSSTSLWKNGSGGGGASWGGITGTLSSQTDLQSALNAKQDNITLTTTGTSGPATLVGSTLNVPQYTGGSGGTFGTHIVVKPKSGVYYSSNPLSGSGGTTTATANFYYLAPFIPQNTLVINEMRVEVLAAAVGGLATMLIFDDLNGLPKNKLLESTNIDCSTTGMKTFTTSFTFTAGTTYWLGMSVNANIGFRSNNTSFALQHHASSSAVNMQYFKAAAFGSVPSSITISPNSDASALQPITLRFRQV